MVLVLFFPFLCLVLLRLLQVLFLPIDLLGCGDIAHHGHTVALGVFCAYHISAVLSFTFDSSFLKFLELAFIFIASKEHDILFPIFLFTLQLIFLLPVDLVTISIRDDIVQIIGFVYYLLGSAI